MKKYDRRIVGYHGCEESVARRLVAGEPPEPSENSYDWLGAGVYFWEFGFDRASRWAQRKCTEPAVVGAIIQLGKCFDLADTRFTAELADAYALFNSVYKSQGTDPPANEGGAPDHPVRKLDSAVINFYLASLEEQGQSYDTVRCPFEEGGAAFEGSRIRLETHTQVAVRELDCILGFFRPILHGS